MKTALLAGGSGLVGGFVRRELQEAGMTVEPLGRAELARLASLPKTPCEFAFCAIGTTRAKAGSAEAFRKVDLELVTAFARHARERGARVFALVSSVGANAGSPLLYPRTKGEAEEAAAELGFPSLVIARPSLLLGERAEARPREAAFQRLAPYWGGLLLGRLRRYRPVTAAAVAAALVSVALEEPPGVTILDYDRLAPGRERS